MNLLQIYKVTLINQHYTNFEGDICWTL